ncbi:cellulose biosynthesis protein BcsN [Pararhizobium gei]|uniref:cellulose biosynthesis protein BcsN n=1 Tax=Pararhizobium gei TaxID=1395951 RepID=UPI0023D98002|nr:cellulose biosynthesis protein BcsN [Rhizobium gei]
MPVFASPSLRQVLAGVLTLVTLAGCGARDGVRLSDAAISVPDETAFALPAAGGPSVVSIVERRFSNSTQQDIFLFTSASTPGQNFLRVQLFGPVGLQMDGQKSLGYSSIRASEISKEMRAAIPGVALARSPLFLQNNYGPFGYAYGRGRGNDACIYAWQQVRSLDGERTVFQNRGTIQVRLRLCEEGASEEKLLSVMYGYTIRGAFNAAGWNPYGEPSKADPGLGRTGNPIYPKTEDLRDAAVPVIRETRPRPVKTTVRPLRTLEKVQPAREAVREETLPLPTSADIEAVVVPSPACVTQPEDAAACK